MTIYIRKYRPEDCNPTRQLFYDTVHNTCAANYTPQQLTAWAPYPPESATWGTSFESRHALVALVDGIIVGFGDMTPAGYLDRLYIHKDHQGQGIASMLCDELEQWASGTITVHASITAKPFFEKRCYRIIRQQQVLRRGVLLTNFIMKKEPLVPCRS